MILHVEIIIYASLLWIGGLVHVHTHIFFIYIVWIVLYMFYDVLLYSDMFSPSLTLTLPLSWSLWSPDLSVLSPNKASEQFEPKKLNMMEINGPYGQEPSPLRWKPWDLDCHELLFGGAEGNQRRVTELKVCMMEVGSFPTAQNLHKRLSRAICTCRVATLQKVFFKLNLASICLLWISGRGVQSGTSKCMRRG